MEKRAIQCQRAFRNRRLPKPCTCDPERALAALRTKRTLINLKTGLFRPKPRGMKKKVQAIIFVLMGAFLLPSYGSAGENTAPEFLVFGRPLSQQAEHLSERNLLRYEAALAEFQHVDDCVTDSENQPRYATSLMRWNRLNTLEKVNVCVFLLASELNNHEQMLDWFNSNGFKAIIIEKPSSAMRIYKREGEGILISAGAPIRGPIRVGFLDRLLAHGVSVGVTFSADGEPLHVNTAVTRK